MKPWITASFSGLRPCGPRGPHIWIGLRSTPGTRPRVLTPLRCCFGTFLKKRLKKLNSKKGAVLENFKKWVPPARSTGGRRGAGDLSPIQRAEGGKIFARPLPRISSRIRNFSYSRRGPLTRLRQHPAPPTGGRFPEGHPALPMGGRLPGGASRPPNGRDVPPPLFKPSPTPNSHIIQ
jgi:hypothetical protein